MFLLPHMCAYICAHIHAHHIPMRIGVDGEIAALPLVLSTDNSAVHFTCSSKVLNGKKPQLSAVEMSLRTQPLLTLSFLCFTFFHSAFLGVCCKLSTCTWVLIARSVFKEVKLRTIQLYHCSVKVAIDNT